MSFLLKQVLLRPGAILDLDGPRLQQLIAQARCSRLLASVALSLEEEQLLERIPPKAARHLQSALLVHEKQKRDLVYDTAKIKQCLQAAGERMVLLKGAAYLMADLPVGYGRLITDIDIIVPRDRIDLAEKNLLEHGWERGDLNSYNDQYYRKWGHEIPPLTHSKRGTTLDVHHNILPPTAAPNVNADLLFDRLIEISPGLFTLSWPDMVIHSATHLFHEGEFHHGLRDLWDLDRMLRDFPDRDSHFWQQLISRAVELELTSSLSHALNYVQQLFNTPVPEDVNKELKNRAMLLRKPLMDFLFLRAFRPDYPPCRLPFTGLALNLLYLRSHYLRMPIYLLLPHLARKAWMRRFEKDKGKAGQEQF